MEHFVSEINRLVFFQSATLAEAIVHNSEPEPYCSGDPVDEEVSRQQQGEGEVQEEEVETVHRRRRESQTEDVCKQNGGVGDEDGDARLGGRLDLPQRGENRIHAPQFEQAPVEEADQTSRLQPIDDDAAHYPDQLCHVDSKIQMADV